MPSGCFHPVLLEGGKGNPKEIILSARHHQHEGLLESHQALLLSRTWKLFCFVFKFYSTHLLILDTQNSCCSVCDAYFAGHKALYRDFVIKLNDLWRSLNSPSHPGLISGLMQLLLPFLIFILNFPFILFNKKIHIYSCNLFFLKKDALPSVKERRVSWLISLW